MGRWIAWFFGMDEETWKRHANPWSVWTRIPILPLLVLAIWSRVWIGWWVLIPVGTLLVWTGLNPRVFRPPKFTDNWPSKGVLGERLWIQDDRDSVVEHWVLPNVLNGLSGAGVLILAWGLYRLALGPTLLGLSLALLGKLWFFDRMVWLYERHRNE